MQEETEVAAEILRRFTEAINRYGMEVDEISVEFATDLPDGSCSTMIPYSKDGTNRVAILMSIRQG